MFDRLSGVKRVLPPFFHSHRDNFHNLEHRRFLHTLRYEKICREVHDKEDALAKARVDLNTELQTSGASVSVPTGNPSAVVASLVDTAHCEDELHDISNPSKPRRNTCASDTTAREDVSSAPSSPRRDAPWLESLRLGQVSAFVIFMH